MDAMHGNGNKSYQVIKTDFSEFVTTNLILDHGSLSSSYNHSFHFTAPRAIEHAVQSWWKKQGLIRPRKLSSDIGTTFSHAIRDHFIVVHNKYRKNSENVWLNYLIKAK